MINQIEVIDKPVSSGVEEPCGNQHELLMGMHDAMDVLTGKWKLQLLGTLIFRGKMRFMDLLREMDGIAAKMLSKELHDLEMHQLVTRTVKETKPITVEYEITEYGKSLQPIIIEITKWGTFHRKKIMGHL
jgi:DNA-binding HxlR family transcriptional regulator